MQTDELIATLRGCKGFTEGMQEILKEAADRLEELDERVAIMTENMDKTWGESYCTSSGAAVFDKKSE